MYLDHYNLKEKPFQININKRSLWLGDSLKEVALTLKNAIGVDKGIIVLYGDTGTGKSSLISRVEQNLERHYIIAKFTNPDIDYLDFFKLLSGHFKIKKKFETKSAFLVNFRNFLRKTFATKKQILLIFDEAHRFKADILKELAFFADIEMINEKMITILLVGDNTMLELLKDEYLKEVSDKITVKCKIHQLAESETNKYINYRLKIAGAERKIFEKETIKEIHSYSQGNLRLINTICDHALKVGYANGLNMVTADVIKKCRKELITKFSTKKRTNHLTVSYKNKHNQKPQQPNLSVSSAPRHWSKAFAIVLVFLSGFIIYVFEIEEFQSWTLEEIVPQSYNFPELENKEYFSPGPVSGNKNVKSLYAENKNESQRLNQDTEPFKAEKEIDLALITKLQSIKPVEKSKTPKFSSENQQTDKVNIVRNQGKSTLFNKKLIIYFEHNSNAFSKDAYEILGNIAGFMMENPDTKVVIKGYSDSSGPYSFNVTISKHRANSVKSYLLARKIAPERIESFGMGPQKPLYSNKTFEGRKLNRRVEIMFISSR
jgi:general secretion pathway protein A